MKSKFVIDSKVKLLNYTINLNTREISTSQNKLKLTEREKDFLLFLKNSKKPQKIKNILESVWKYSKGIETHTVETHVHRLRKKFLNSFNDNNFIKNNKEGYYIQMGRRNFIAKDLYSTKYKKRIIKPKKGKGSFKRKKK